MSGLAHRQELRVGPPLGVEDSPYYREVQGECAVFRHAHAQRLPLMLKGPTGAGKSRLVEYMAAQLQVPLVTIACHDETSAVDLVGRHLLIGGETVWQDGPLTRAVRTGAILYLDEVAEARPDVLVVIHALTDHRRQLFIERSNEALTAPASFMLVVSFNPGYQRGLKELKPSTRQRFVALSLGYPASDIEREIVCTETGCPESLGKALVKFANQVRTQPELGLAETVSTRLLVDAAKLIASGLPTRRAVEVGVVEPLTDDADIRAALRDAVALLFS